MISNVIDTKLIPDGGATISLPVTGTETLYIIDKSGTGTLSGNVTISNSGTPQEGYEFVLIYLAGLTIGGFTVTIFGQSLTVTQASKKLRIRAVYHTAAWQTTLEGLFGQAAVIDTADLVNKAVTLGKTADITRGSLVVGGVANAPTAVDFKTSGRIPIGDGTDLNSVAVTGAISITSAGVTAINAVYITNAMISATAAIDYSKLAALTSGNILVGSAGNVATSVSMTGDISISNTGLTAIVAGVILNADINASAGIAFSKLQTLTSGNILVGSAGNVATSTTVSGDGTLSNTGVLTITSRSGFYTREYNNSGVTTTGTIEETLSTATYTGGDLADERTLQIFVTAVTAANANNKRLKVKWQGNILADSGTVTSNNLKIFVEIQVTRKSSTSLYFKSTVMINGVAPIINHGSVAAIDFTIAQSITVTGETSAAAGDLTWYETNVFIYK